MKYVSIDIETTGLDESYCQILEIGAVIDIDGVTPVENLPTFHCYVTHPYIVGEAYALSMHATILRRIATCEQPWQYVSNDVAALRLGAFLVANGLGDFKTLAAGKNFAGFDLQFLKRLPDFKHAMGFHHRCIDPGMMYWQPKIDDVPPASKTCMERAGLDGDVKHTAVEDAQMVIRLVRTAIARREFEMAQCIAPALSPSVLDRGGICDLSA